MHTILMVYYHEIIDCKKVINYHKKVKSYHNNDKLFKITKEKKTNGKFKRKDSSIKTSRIC